ncbi:hypothetical protein A3D07_01440 [Candidatus Curtissbacteria bacterium RIFCSPHIGHO2_02_FULL_42_15]|uniref:Methyltransferase domain-containing protein n=2 Tax=Candidatus Curtissiibacteriota TaxID=1752717 RepID=A0A1F5GHM3_9BACT|nr:MAG: hypothetical protein A3D07_01440 [Candidatus Curtissbacteria bacterium RIFCSPHIGHO2_02_FULL_42_15]
MAKQADEVLENIQKAQKRTFLPIIGRVKGQVLVRIVESENPQRILEIGTLVGYSAILMAKHLPKGAKIVSIEVDKNSASQARKNIAEAQLEEKIELIVGDARREIKKLKEKFDVLFLDAAKEQYLKLAEPKLKEGAIVVADNVKIFKDDMADFLEYVRQSGRFRSERIDFGQDAVEVAIKLD